MPIFIKNGHCDLIQLAIALAKYSVICLTFNETSMKRMTGKINKAVFSAVLVAGLLALNFEINVNTEKGPLVTLGSTKALADVGAEEDPVKTGGDGSGWFWQAQTITCTVTKTITYGGGPVPGSVAYSESYQGTKRICIDGWSLCLSNFCSA